MAYKTMKEAFHEGKSSSEEELRARLALAETERLGFNLRENELFFIMTSEVYEQLLKATKLDKEISKLVNALPGRAVDSYIESCLIEEIVLTNKIEGVHSTRKEITEVLDRLKQNDKSGRFNGLVQKYVMLSNEQHLVLDSCQDIRNLYNELVLDEVVQADANNVPDGKMFRKREVNVCNAAGEIIHAGIEPEEKIMELLDKALSMLSYERIQPLCRAALFHYIFGYVHPFYDGNGRMNRFISSYVLNAEYELLVGLRLSYAIKENIKAYYKAFETCENVMNKGDLTPFVITFAKIVVAAMTDVRDSLEERSEKLSNYNKKIIQLKGEVSAPTLEIASALVTATLFSTYGLDAAYLGKIFEVSRQTIYKRVEPLRERNILVAKKVGRKTYYSIDLEVLSAFGSSAT